MSTYLNSIFYNKPNTAQPGILDRMRRYFFTTDTKAAMLETIVETRESIEEVVSEPVVVSIETKPSLEIKYEDMISPFHPDTLFWCLFIAINGYDEYLQIDRNYGVKELELKQTFGNFIKENPSKMKLTNNKITKASVQEILSDFLTTQKETNLLCLIGMIVYYNINVIMIDPSKRFAIELLANVDIKSNTYVLYKDTFNKYKINPEPISDEMIVKLKTDLIFLNSYARPLKASSMYKLDELIDIAKKIGIYDEVNKPKKPDLYNLISETIRWT